MQGPSTVQNANPAATTNGAPSNGGPAGDGMAHHREEVARTDFAQFSHQELIAMLAAADPDSAHRTAAHWEHTAALMSEQASALDGQLAGFSDQWQGDAASSYQVMIKDLSGGVRQVADHARRMRDLSAHAADALDTARATMPAPVDVPAVSPETMAMATTPMTPDPTASAATLLAAQQEQSKAVAAVQQQQAAQGAANAAHAQAVQVMTTLANSYTDAAISIPASPYASDGSYQGLSGGGTGGGSAAPLFGNGSGVPDSGSGSLGDLVDPITGELVAGAEGVSSNVPLFGSMFTAGLAAASAASIGRFGSLLPKLPSFLTRRSTPEFEGSGSLFDPLTGRPLNPYETGTDLAGKVGAGVTDPAAAAALAGGGAGGGGAGGLGGFGGGGLGGIGGGAVAGGIGAAAPSAYTALAGSAAGAGGLPAAAGVSGLSAGASGVAAGVGGAAGTTAGGMPMGMMPMGAGMGGGMDGARRSPAWLVETDDVWGEQSVVAPSVVGDDAPPPDPRPWIGR